MAEAEAPVEFRISARYVGERIDTRGVVGYEVLAPSPLLLRVGAAGRAVLLRYGVVVSIGLTPPEEEALLSALLPQISRPFREVESEEITATIDPTRPEGVDAAGRLWLRGTDPGRLGVVAETVAKSTALAHYESEVGEVFNQL